MTGRKMDGLALVSLTSILQHHSSKTLQVALRSMLPDDASDSCCRHDVMPRQLAKPLNKVCSYGVQHSRSSQSGCRWPAPEWQACQDHCMGAKQGATSSTHQLAHVSPGSPPTHPSTPHRNPMTKSPIPGAHQLPPSTRLHPATAAQAALVCFISPDTQPDTQLFPSLPAMAHP